MSDQEGGAGSCRGMSVDMNSQASDSNEDDYGVNSEEEEDDDDDGGMINSEGEEVGWEVTDCSEWRSNGDCFGIRSGL